MARMITVEQLRRLGREHGWCITQREPAYRRFRRLFGERTTLTIPNLERWLSSRTRSQRSWAVMHLDELVKARHGKDGAWDFVDETRAAYNKHRKASDPKARRELARAFCRALKEGT